ncbi:hypothetical protein baBA2_000926 (plasmid) [Borrelia anserina]|uniref:Lipoprotein n=1 Tax=Borrelia anserina Es TaxID=1365188 RepID=A0ABN4UF17_BORAN|nr:hypothetical protein [Borrelia anserina]APR65332.1 hypothetical protein N187_A13 [Borrelia anserina Es]UPA07300.1 hypothetical protein baBA2_000926 [Borrelia anserina]
MRKFNLIFLLSCLLSMISCDQEQSDSTFSTLDADFKLRKINIAENNPLKPHKIDRANPNEKLQPQKGQLQPNKKDSLEYNPIEIKKAHTKLSESVSKYKSELINEKNEFYLQSNLLNIPFKDIDSRFISPEEQSNIYLSLGYNIEVSKKLKVLLGKLNLKKDFSFGSNNDIEIANNLLNLLWQIGSYTKKTIYVYLDSDNLNQIKNRKTVTEINEIYNSFENFIQEKNKAIKIIQDQITSLALKKDKQAILDELKRTVGLNGSNGADIQKASYSIVTMADTIKAFLQ